MAETFKVEIVTPERHVVDDVAEEMQIPATRGYIGILPGHAPLITELAVGEISYRSGNMTHRIAVAWGFAEVLPDRVTILAESAEMAHEIDVPRARQARQRAESALNSSDPNVNFDETLKALKRAEVRLEVASKG